VKIDFLPCNPDVLSKRRDIEQEVRRQGHRVIHSMVNPSRPAHQHNETQNENVHALSHQQALISLTLMVAYVRYFFSKSVAAST